jgi:hypothetical protein
LSTPILATMPSSGFRSALHHFTGHAHSFAATGAPRAAPRATTAGVETDLSCSTVGCVIVPLPIRRRVHRCCTSKLFTPSMAFTHALGARLPYCSPIARGLFDDAVTGFLSHGPITCSPPNGDFVMALRQSGLPSRRPPGRAVAADARRSGARDRHPPGDLGSATRRLLLPDRADPRGVRIALPS